MLSLDITLKPSKRYLVLFSLFWMGTGLIVICLPIHFFLKSGLLGIIAVYGFFILWHDILLKSSNSIIRLRTLSEGKWLLTTPKQEIKGELSGKSTITRHFCALCFKIENTFFEKSCLILKDAIPEEPYRQLIICLRYH